MNLSFNYFIREFFGKIHFLNIRNSKLRTLLYSETIISYISIWSIICKIIQFFKTIIFKYFLQDLSKHN